MQKTTTSVLTIIGLLVAGSLIFFLFNNSDTPENQPPIADSSAYMKGYNVYAIQTPPGAMFAGETVPVERWYVREALDREFLVNSYWHSATLLLIKKAPKYFPIIEPILAEEGVPDDFKYLACIESALMPTAQSPANAVGIWQFIKSAGTQYGLEINSEVDERYHIEKSTRAACKYLKSAYRKFGNWTLAAASYNRGLAGIDKRLKEQNANSYYDLLLNPETARYVYRIVAVKYILEDANSYGFRVRPEDKYHYIPTQKIAISSNVEDWAAWAKQQGINYPILKDLNPWLRQTYLKNPSKKTYQLELPATGYADFDYTSYPN